MQAIASLWLVRKSQDDVVFKVDALMGKLQSIEALMALKKLTHLTPKRIKVSRWTSSLQALKQ